MVGLPAPAPLVNDETRPFWDATAEGRIHLPRCGACDLTVWYPRSFCPRCHGEVEWVDVEPRGSVYSFSIVRKGQGRRWQEAAPYVVAYVELVSGPRMLTNIVGCEPEEVSVGMEVEATFDPTDDGPSLIRFRPAGSAG